MKADGCRVIPESDMRKMLRDVKAAEQGQPGFWMAKIDTHLQDFVTAIKIGRKSGNPYERAAHVAENAALGAVAVRFPGETLLWDNATMSITNNQAANALIKPEYRKGYNLTL